MATAKALLTARVATDPLFLASYTARQVDILPEQSQLIFLPKSPQAEADTRGMELGKRNNILRFPSSTVSYPVEGEVKEPGAAEEGPAEAEQQLHLEPGDLVTSPVEVHHGHGLGQGHARAHRQPGHCCL